MENNKRVVLRLVQFNPILNRYIFVQQFELQEVDKANKLLDKKLKEGLDAKINRVVI